MPVLSAIRTRAAPLPSSTQTIGFATSVSSPCRRTSSPSVAGPTSPLAIFFACIGSVDPMGSTPPPRTSARSVSPEVGPCRPAYREAVARGEGWRVLRDNNEDAAGPVLHIEPLRPEQVRRGRDRAFDEHQPAGDAAPRHRKAHPIRLRFGYGRRRVGRRRLGVLVGSGVGVGTGPRLPFGSPGVGSHCVESSAAPSG